MMALALAGCGGAAARNDEGAAKAAFDEAVAARLQGDELLWRDRMLKLATTYPDTRYGRRAQTDLGGGDALTAVAALGVVAGVVVPAFVRMEGKAASAALEPPDMPVDGVPGGVEGAE
jgi:hypothetical protein